MSAPATTAAATRGRETEDDANVPEHLLCGVCLDAPPSHVFQCRNGHLLCSGCLAQLRARAVGRPTTCPTCRVELPDAPIRCLAVEHSIALLPATCRHCTERTTRGALASHEVSCASAPDVKCAAHAEGCEWTGRQSDRAALQAECVIVRLCARFDVEREETSQATARVVDAFLDPTPEDDCQRGRQRSPSNFPFSSLEKVQNDWPPPSEPYWFTSRVSPGGNSFVSKKHSARETLVYYFRRQASRDKAVVCHSRKCTSRNVVTRTKLVTLPRHGDAVLGCEKAVCSVGNLSEL
jgi:hypothetical protein